MEAFRFPSSLVEGPPRRRIVEEDYVPDYKMHILYVTIAKRKETGYV